MVGQGSPEASRPPRASPINIHYLLRTWWVLYSVIVLWGACASSALAADASMRLRIAWGGGAERQWKGTVRASDGTLTEPQALGVEADEPGSIWEADGQIFVRERSPRAYNGVDVLVTATSDSKLSVALAPLTASEDASPIEIRLSEVVGESFSSQLDPQGNRLLVMRSPGDKLRVRFDRNSLVFSPGE